MAQDDVDCRILGAVHTLVVKEQVSGTQVGVGMPGVLMLTAITAHELHLQPSTLHLAKMAIFDGLSRLCRWGGLGALSLESVEAIGTPRIFFLIGAIRPAPTSSGGGEQTAAIIRVGHGVGHTRNHGFTRPTRPLSSGLYRASKAIAESGGRRGTRGRRRVIRSGGGGLRGIGRGVSGQRHALVVCNMTNPHGGERTWIRHLSAVRPARGLASGDSR